MKEDIRARRAALYVANQDRATVHISPTGQALSDAADHIERLRLDLDCANRALERAHRENAQLRAELAARGR